MMGKRHCEACIPCACGFGVTISSWFALRLQLVGRLNQLVRACAVGPASYRREEIALLTNMS